MHWIPETLAELRPLDRIRRNIRGNELWFIGLALLVGLLAGATTVFQSSVAHWLQGFLYELPPDGRLSTMPDVPLSKLLLLPLGGGLLGLFTVLVRARKRRLIDAVEANALHGGRMSMRDSLIVCGQTILSNGFGASVGLEAAYVQMGAGAGSLLGRRAHLRRADMRTLVGAGAGAAIAAAFGAPLTGAFYAFEIVIGAYTPAALAPVAAACLGAVAVAELLGVHPYQIYIAPTLTLRSIDYLLYVFLAVFCAGFGVALMRMVGIVDQQVSRLRIPYWGRPVIGGLLLLPMAAFTPQILSAGHGALSNDMLLGYSLWFVAGLLVLKSVASIVSLGFGFRGGLFFASLFLGSLLGHFYAGLVSVVSGAELLDTRNASLIGMAALAVAVVGGPLTMSMLVLEVTHDFVLTSVVIAGALVCNTIVRHSFGYSFSTWRLHLRGETIKSARDISWAKAFTASRLMRKESNSVASSLPIGRFRQKFPLGSASRVVLVDADGHYAGIVSPAAAHALVGMDRDEAPVLELASNTGRFLDPDMDIIAMMKAFDAAQSDELAVVDADRNVQGVVTEKFVRKRYAEELENHQKELYGER